LQLALEKCRLIKELSALKVVCVEYFESAKLQEFYEFNEFRVLQKNENGCIISFLKF
jgi:hypothetical protein